VAREERLAFRDRSPAVLGKETIARQQRPAAAAAEPVAQVVAEDRRGGADGDHRGEKQVPGPCQRSGGEQRGLARHRDAGGFGEDEHEEGAVSDLRGNREHHEPEARAEGFDRG
jgi:hypothetical protein